MTSQVQMQNLDGVYITDTHSVSPDRAQNNSVSIPIKSVDEGVYEDY